MKKREKLAIVRQHYPKAITTSDSVEILFDILEEQYDLEPHQIMLADSICSDDVNTIEYPARAYEMLGPFKMGGLNGFPFTGLTGMGAFAGHVPDDGAVFVFYAPHIGVTKEGTLGEIQRLGQSKHTGCCGAARAALAKLEKGEIEEDHITDLDYQMNTIEQIFFRSKERISNSAAPLKEATEVMYEAIDERICLLASKTNYPCRYLILIGAILINGDHDIGSFNTVRRFQIIDLSTRSATNLMPEFELRIK